jgi:hypothetical protein
MRNIVHLAIHLWHILLLIGPWLGHCDKDTTRKAAREYGLLLTGSWKPCEACAAGEAKQKNVPKESEHKPADKDANRIFLDIATVKQETEEWAKCD